MRWESAAEDVGVSLLGSLSLHSGQSLLPWLSRSLPLPHTVCGKRWMKSACSFFFFLGAACFAYQRHGHFFYCHTSLQYQVFLQKTERQRSGGGAGAFNVLLGVWVHKANGLAWVCKLRSCSSQTTSCPGVQEAGGPRWRWGPDNCVNPRRLVCGDNFVTMSLHTELCFEGGCPPHWLQ